MSSMASSGNAAVGRPHFRTLPSSVSIDAAPLTPISDDSKFSPALLSDALLGQKSHGAACDLEELLLERKASFSKKQIENAVTKISSDWKNELQEYENYMPANVRVGYFDVAILYAEADREQAERYKKHLENDIEMTCKKKVKVVLYDGPEMVSLTGAITKQLDHVLERCTQIFMYLTEIFCKEAWMEYASEACLVEAIYNKDKQWCCVPIFNYPRSSTPFRVPMVLNCLKGVNFYHNDQFYRKAVGRLIEDKMHKRWEKEIQHEQEQRQWLVAYKTKQMSRIMSCDAQLEHMKTSLDQREDDCCKYMNTLHRQLSNSRTDKELSKPVQYFEPFSFNLSHPLKAEQSKMVCQDNKDSVSLSDHVQPMKDQQNTPQNLDDEVRNILLSKSNTSSYPVQEKQARKVEHPNSQEVVDAAKMENKSISSGNPICELQKQEFSCYGSDSNDNLCRSSSTAQQDAAASVSGEKILNDSMAHSDIQDNLPHLSLLQSEEEGNEYINHLDDKTSSETSSNVRSRSTATTTIPNLSAFNSLNDEDTSTNFLRSASIQDSVPDQRSSNVPSLTVPHTRKGVDVTDNAKPPHAINTSLGTFDLDVDAISLPADPESLYMQDGDINSKWNGKTKIVVKEVHHHHYQHKDHESQKQVINIIGAKSVQIGSNTMQVNEDDDSDCEELPTEQKSEKNVKIRSTENQGVQEHKISAEHKANESSLSDVSRMRDEEEYFDTYQEPGGHNDGITSLTGSEEIYMSSQASSNTRPEPVVSLVHPLDPSTGVIANSLGTESSLDNSSVFGRENSLKENTDPTIFYVQKEKKSRAYSSSDNSRCTIS